MTAKYLLISAALLLPVSPVRANEADAYLGEDREALFRSYVADIRDGQVLSAEGFKRLGTTWEKELEKAHKRFLYARTRTDVYYVLLSLKNTLHVVHGRLSVPDSLKPPRERLFIPLKLRPSRDDSGGLRFIVDESGLPGVEKGFVLEKYQGKPPAVAMADFLEWHQSNSPEHLEFEFSRWLSARDSIDVPLPEPRIVDLVFREGTTGREVRAEAVFKKGRGPEPEDADYAGRDGDFTGLNYSVYPDTASGTLVLRYTSFYYDFGAAELWNKMLVLSYMPEELNEEDYSSPRRALERIDVDQLLSYLKSARPKYGRLLIDLRENDGGGVNQRLLKALADKPFKTTTRAMAFTPLMRRDAAFFESALEMVSPAMRVKIRKEFAAGAQTSSVSAFDCAQEICEPGDARVEPTGPGLGYKTYLLTGPYCVSSCDQFVSVFVDNGLGEAEGLPSMGESSPFRGSRKFTMADGETFSIVLNAGLTYRPNGELLTGNPPRPSKLIYPGPGYLRKVLDSLPPGGSAFSAVAVSGAEDLKYASVNGAPAMPLSLDNDYFRTPGNPARDFWAFSSFYVPQENDYSCSVAAVSMALNALAARRVRYDSEENITSHNLLEKVKSVEWGKLVSPEGAGGRHGLTLDQLAAVSREALASSGAKNISVSSITVAEQPADGLEAFRRALAENETNPNDIMLLHFTQDSLTGAKGGPYPHISPVGAYDAKTGRILIFDVDRKWYEPYWAAVTQVYKAMSVKTPAFGPGGYVLLRLEK